MHRLTKAEKAAAAAVVAAAAGVAGAGVTLMKRYTRLMAAKAAAKFGQFPDPKVASDPETERPDGAAPNREPEKQES